MNPWIDVLGWSLVVACIIFLRYEIPRATREIRKILRESQELQEHVSRERDSPSTSTQDRA
jgi:Sec-independent protein translocase protein TatA